MKTKRKKEAVKIIEKHLEHLRDINRQLEEDDNLELGDPVADVQVTKKDDHVLMTYDGVGYDWFSYNCEYGTKTRDKMFGELEDAGFRAEDRNNWSLTVWED